MLLHLPGSLEGLLSLFRGCFTQPSFQTFRALVAGQISQTALHTVTGMLIGARLSAVWDHCRAHRFFSRRRWSVDELGLRLAELIADRLLEPDQPVLVAVDDTLLRRRGRRIFACGWQHDNSANTKGKAFAWGNNWVVAGIVVRLPFCGRAVCLPVLFRLWRPKRDRDGIPRHWADPERPGKPELARRLVDLLAERLAPRRVHVVGDAAYAAKPWRGLEGGVTVTFRLRRGPKLNAPPPPPPAKRRPGRPPVRGARLPSLDEIARDPATSWRQTTLLLYGKHATRRIHDRPCVWYHPWLGTPCRLILVADKPGGYQLALITTDLDTDAAQLVQRYADRWSIEVCLEEAKNIAGVGEARNRTPRAVGRTVPFQFLCMNLTLIWYALHGHSPDVVHEHRTRAPWYRTKTDPSFADMLAKLRRVIIAAQFRQGRRRDPKPTEIAQIQAASAAAGI